MASSPEILYPITNWSGINNKYYSTSLSHIIQGIVPAVISTIIDGTVVLTVEQRYKILRNGVTSGYSNYSTANVVIGETSSEVDQVPWSFDSYGLVDLQEDDILTVQFKTVERRRIDNGISSSIVITESTPSTVIVEVISEEQIESSVIRPTGVSLKRKPDSVKVLVPSSSINISDNSDFVGVNFYLSLDAGGGDHGYQLVNNSYVNHIDTVESVEEVKIVNETDSQADDLTVTTTQTRQITRQYYTYTITPSVLSSMVQEGKIRNVFLSDGVSLDVNTIYYMIATIVVYDNALNQVIESSYSLELEGKFLEYKVDYRGLPERTRNDVLRSMSKRILTNNSQINIISGSAIRDIIDPVTLEFEKYYTIQDFVFKALSIDSLIAFDDANGDGISDTLQENLDKLRLADALGFRSARNFQIFIDQQFDKLAANYKIVRKGSVRATGSVLFYIRNSFNNNILIPNDTVVTAPADGTVGRSAVNFRVVGTSVIESDNKDYYYNAARKRYEIEVDIEAIDAGSSGNVPAGSITTVSGLNANLNVINLVPTNFGEDRESNRGLTNRIKLGYTSFDSGTEGGYSATVLSVPGITETRIEKTGDPLMMRDYDRDSMRHLGGKIDAYVKGDRVAQTIDQVAFQYGFPTDVTGSKVSERFDVTNASEFRIRCRNPKVSSTSPIVFVSSVRNVTRGKDYDLTGREIVGEGDTIVLSNNIGNISIGMAAFDVISVSYKYRSSNYLKLSNQPVSGIVSIVDSKNNVVDEENYRLVRLEDPLDKGSSNLASDSVEFLFDSPNEFEEFIAVTDEQHDLFFNVPTALNNKGVDISSVRVYDPNDSSMLYIKDIDYTVTAGNEIDSTTLLLKAGSMIRQGGRVSVDYAAAQNFLVTYTYNSLVNLVAEKIGSMRHACADVAVKTATGNHIDLSMQVIRKSGVNTSRLKSRIQTTLANVISNLKMGEGLTQGTVLSTVKNVDGVKDVVMPMIKMSKRNGSFIPNDPIGLVPFEVYSRSNSFGIISYRTINPVLTYKTQSGGGPDNLFRSVYENNIALTLVDDPSEVHKAAGQAYIQSDGKIIVSTLDGRPPHIKSYSASYYVYYENDKNIVGDIDVNQTEYLRIDSVSLANIEIIDTKVVKKGL